MAENASKRIDEAFAKAEPWAQKVCNDLRLLVHQAIPQVKEDWKWGPHFYYQGMVCGIWPFKKHVSLVFFKGSALKDPHAMLVHGTENVNNRMMKFKEGEALPKEKIKFYLKEAALLNEKGVKISSNSTPWVMSDFFLRKLEEAQLVAAFEQLSNACKKEYGQYVDEAKKWETKERRWEKVLPMIREKVSKFHRNNGEERA